MNEDVLHAVGSDLLLATVLFVLFAYVARLSRGLRGIVTWGAAHFVYTFGATLLDAGGPWLALHAGAGASSLAVNLGTAIACAGIAGLGCAMAQFAQQRALRPGDAGFVLLALSASLLAWALRGTREAQGVALSLVEVAALAVIIWQLRTLRLPPDRLPARMMIGGCVLLVLLYGSAIPGWSFGRFGLADIWVSIDLSIWFMLNFCMLMLTSFRAAESLRHSAMRDPLTGALNRRGLDGALRQQVDASADTPWIAVIALDLDHFKAINDRHGHQGGDRVLQSFGDLVRAQIGRDDLFARLGGEEFAVVLADARDVDPASFAERLRAQVEPIALAPDLPAARATVSIGVSTAEGREPFADVLRRADEALYAAKRNGRNRVEIADVHASRVTR